MKKVFITGTGTDIGKTYITAALLSALRDYMALAVLKPVMSGVEDWKQSDAAKLLRANGQELTHETFASVCGWLFSAALSPEMAAAREGKQIIFGEVVEFCRQAIARDDADALLIEGAGGVMSPVSRHHHFLQLAQVLKPDVTILVAGTYVGSISHTLTALEALRQAGIRPRHVVLNESPGSPVSPEETQAALRNHRVAEPMTLVRYDASKEGWQRTFSVTQAASLLGLSLLDRV